MTTSDPGASRREFLRTSAGCCAHIMLLSAFRPAEAAAKFGDSRNRVVAREPWGRIEAVADGIWSMISTPLEDRTTLCNGGIIRGSSGVVVIESFARPEGAAWLSQQARELTGRWPDHVILTHYHGDHTAGIAGYARDDGAPSVHVTPATLELVRQQDGQRGEDPGSARSKLLASATPIDAESTSTLDLGGRMIRITPRRGHTRSDVTIEVDDPAVVFCGDLVWNRMFPNYVDAVPSNLSRDVRALQRARPTAYVPGHGPMATMSDLVSYIELIDSVEAAAKDAKARGMSAADAAKEYKVPARIGEWMLFSPRYYEVAIGAWLREIG